MPADLPAADGVRTVEAWPSKRGIDAPPRLPDRGDDISTRAPTRRHAGLRGDGRAREWPIVGARGTSFAVIIEPWT